MSRERTHPHPLRPLVEGLERRVLYSADAAALGIDVPAEALDDGHAVAVETDLFHEALEEQKSDVEGVAGESLHVVVFDARLEDLDLLREAAKEGGAEVLLFHAEEDSSEEVLQRISAIAEERGEEIDSISIVSHGSAGRFHLGGDLVDASSAVAHADAWADVGSHLADGGNLYLYGCNVVDGSGDGQALLDRLAEATGADVFASSDLSGAGGDWDLEASSSGDEGEAAAGLTAPIDSSVIESMTSALVDYNEPNWNGSGTFTDGPISFTLEYSQGGSIDWHYDGATNTLTVTDLNGGGPNADFTITDNNGGLIIDTIDLPNFRGTLIADPDVGSVDFGSGFPTSFVVGGGTGTVGTISLTGPVDDAGVVDADVGTIDIAGGGIDDGTTIRVEGDVGDFQIAGDIGPGAGLDVTGDLPTLNITGTVDGDISVGGGMTSLGVSGDMNGTVDVGGDLTTLTVGGGGDSTIQVGGDLDDAGWSGNFTGTLKVMNTIGQIDIIDDGFNEYSNSFGTDTMVCYDGTTNTGTPAPGGNTAPSADPLDIVLVEDGSSVVHLTGTDPDVGDTVDLYRVETLPSDGTLYLGTTALTGPTDVTAAQISSGALTFVPDANWNGSTSFEFSAHDGEAWSDSTALVSITVDPVNDAPDAGSMSFTISENTTRVVTLTGSDTDAGDAIELFRVETIPANGTLYLGSTALTGPTDITPAQVAANQLVFDPDPGWVGTTEFAYRSFDGDDWSAEAATVDIESVAVVIPESDPEPETGTDPDPETGPDPDTEPDPPTDQGPEPDPEAPPSQPPGSGPDERNTGLPPAGTEGSAPPSLPDLRGESLDPLDDGSEPGDEGTEDVAEDDDPVAVNVASRLGDAEEAEVEQGLSLAMRRLELDVPPVGEIESEVTRQALERVEQEELRVSGFEAASVALSATVVAIMSRSATLVAMAVSSIPAWHRFDPLAVVAMSESSRRAWAQRQKEAETDEDEKLRDVLGD